MFYTNGIDIFWIILVCMIETYSTGFTSYISWPDDWKITGFMQKSVACYCYSSKINSTLYAGTPPAVIIIWRWPSKVIL